MSARLGRRLFAEAVGTALLVGIGTGAIVVAHRVGGASIGWIALAWFAAVSVPVLLVARVSGAHLNPAVTLALVAGRRFPLRELPFYVGAQVAGAFAGSAAVWGIEGDGAELGATQFRPGFVGVGAFGEFAFTFLLVLVVLLLVDWGPGMPRWALLAPGAAVGFSTYVIGPWTGSSLNPARTLAPAVLSGTFANLPVYLLVVPLGGLAAVPVANWIRARPVRGLAPTGR
jgi:glycerol uptake facilitator protein